MPCPSILMPVPDVVLRLLPCCILGPHARGLDRAARSLYRRSDFLMPVPPQGDTRMFFSGYCPADLPGPHARGLVRVPGDPLPLPPQMLRNDWRRAQQIKTHLPLPPPGCWSSCYFPAISFARRSQSVQVQKVCVCSSLVAGPSYLVRYEEQPAHFDAHSRTTTTHNHTRATTEPPFFGSEQEQHETRPRRRRRRSTPASSSAAGCRARPPPPSQVSVVLQSQLSRSADPRAGCCSALRHAVRGGGR